MSDKFEDILNSSPLESDRFGKPSSLALKASVLVLFEAMAKADHNVLPMEYAKIVNLVTSFFQCEIEESGLLVEMANQMNNEANLEAALSSIKHHYSSDQRALIFSAVWKVALADDLIHENEKAFFEKLYKILSISKAEAEQAIASSVSNR